MPGILKPGPHPGCGRPKGSKNDPRIRFTRDFFLSEEKKIRQVFLNLLEDALAGQKHAILEVVRLFSIPPRAVPLDEDQDLKALVKSQILEMIPAELKLSVFQKFAEANSKINEAPLKTDAA